MSTNSSSNNSDENNQPKGAMSLELPEGEEVISKTDMKMFKKWQRMMQLSEQQNPTTGEETVFVVEREEHVKVDVLTVTQRRD